jgi:hypothetical protein
VEVKITAKRRRKARARKSRARPCIYLLNGWCRRNDEQPLLKLLLPRGGTPVLPTVAFVGLRSNRVTCRFPFLVVRHGDASDAQ